MTKDLIKQEESEDGSKKLIMDLDAIQKQGIEIAVLRDESQGLICELQSHQYTAKELLDFAGQGMEWMRQNKQNKIPVGVN